MNKSFKKALVFLVVLSIVLSSSSFGFAARRNTPINPFVIHETKSSENISSGVIHENILKFTAKGWWNINILKVDLNNQYTELKTLFSKNGISSTDKVSNMVKDSGALAGINADFFNYKPIPNPLGTAINDGEIISSPISKEYNPTPTFVLDKNKNPYITFLDRRMAVKSSASSEEVILSAINKASVNYGEVILYNKHWRKNSIGNTLHPDLIEVVVQDNVVTDLRIGQEPVSIPENGYIIVGRDRVQERLLNNFHIGDTVELNLTATPDFESIKMAVGGGSIILKDGVITNSNPNIPAGENPRTGVGITQDGKTLLLVTIDGRDSSFKGVNQATFAQIFKELGAYNVISMDGGGSTAMVINPKDDNKPKVINKPSDGGERKVISGVGVFSNAPQGTLASIKLSTDDTKMFANTSRKLYLKGYDENYNPVNIDMGMATFKVEGVTGEFNGNSFKATKPGTAKITVDYMGITDTLEIKVLDKVKDVTTTLGQFYVDINSQRNLGKFFGKDKEGFKAEIYPEDIKFTVTGDIGWVENGAFYSGAKPGAGGITATIGDGIENILVTVGNSEGVLVESFENIDTLQFTSWPEFVTGSTSLHNEAKEGTSSLKLQYDFTQGEGTRAAYVKLLQNGQEGLALQGVPKKLGLWIYGDSSGGWLRGDIKDSTGKYHKVDFAKRVDWNGWKYVTGDIPSEVTYPISINRIYLAEIDSLKKYAGEIYFDGLVALYPAKFDSVVLPLSTTLVDANNKAEKKQKGGFSFAVTTVPTDLDKIVGYKASDKIKEKVNAHNGSIFFGETSDEFKKGLKTITNGLNIEVAKGYKPYVYNNILFIKANSSSNSLRASNPEQWLWLKHDLEKSAEKNIVLILKSPVDNFTDRLEAELLHNTLCEAKQSGKNIWVVQGGNGSSTDLRDGIRYIQINTKPVVNPKDIYDLRIAEFVVNGDNITYQIKPIFAQPQIK